MKPTQSISSAPSLPLNPTTTSLSSMAQRSFQAGHMRFFPLASTDNDDGRPSTPAEKRAEVIRLIDEALRIVDEDDFDRDILFRQ